MISRVLKCVWVVLWVAVAARSGIGADAVENRGNSSPAPLPRIIRGPLLPSDYMVSPSRSSEVVPQATPSSPAPLPRIIRGPIESATRTTTVITSTPTTAPQPVSSDHGLIESLRRIESGVNRSSLLQAIPRPPAGSEPTDLIQNLRDLERSINSTGILERIRSLNTPGDAPGGLIESLHNVDNAVRTHVRPALERISNEQLPSQAPLVPPSKR